MRETQRSGEAQLRKWRAALTHPITLIQLGETVLFAGIAAVGILGRHPMVALVGAGLLTGKAVTNLLPVQLRYQRRAWAGYASGAAFFGLALVAYVLVNRP